MTSHTITSNSNRLIRIVALSAAGSAILYSNSDPYSKTFVSVSVPAPLRDSVSRQCQIMKEFIRSPSTLPSNLSPYGNVEVLFSRIGSDPSEDVNKDASEKIGGGSKSIATAVAMVIPAVVYLAVPRWDGKTLGTGRATGTLIDHDVVRPWLGMKMLDITFALQLFFKGSYGGAIIKAETNVWAWMRTSEQSVLRLCSGQVTELMEDQVGMPLKVVVKRSKDTCVLLTVVPEETIPEVY